MAAGVSPVIVAAAIESPEQNASNASVVLAVLRASRLRGIPAAELLSALSEPYQRSLVSELPYLDEGDFEDIAPAVREAAIDDAGLRAALRDRLSRDAEDGRFSDGDGEYISRGATSLWRAFGVLPSVEAIEKGLRVAVGQLRMRDLDAWGELEGSDPADALSRVSETFLQEAYLVAMHGGQLLDIERAAYASGVPPKLQGQLLASVTAYRFRVAQGLEYDDDERGEYTVGTVARVFPGLENAEPGKDSECRMFLAHSLFNGHWSDASVEALARALPEIADWQEAADEAAAFVSAMPAPPGPDEDGADFRWQIRQFGRTLSYLPIPFEPPSSAWTEAGYQILAREHDLRAMEGLVRSSGIRPKGIVEPGLLRGLYEVPWGYASVKLRPEVDESFYERHGLNRDPADGSGGRADRFYAEAFWDTVAVAQYWKRAKALVGAPPDPSTVQLGGASLVLRHPEHWDVFFKEADLGPGSSEAWFSKLPRETWAGVFREPFEKVCEELGVVPSRAAVEDDRLWADVLEDISIRRPRSMSLLAACRILRAAGAERLRPNLIPEAIARDVGRSPSLGTRQLHELFGDLEGLQALGLWKFDIEAMAPLVRHQFEYWHNAGLGEFVRAWRRNGYPMHALHEACADSLVRIENVLAALDAFAAVGEYPERLFPPGKLAREFAGRGAMVGLPHLAAMCRRSETFSSALLAEALGHDVDSGIFSALRSFIDPSALAALGVDPTKVVRDMEAAEPAVGHPDAAMRRIVGSPAAFGAVWARLLRSGRIDALRRNFGDAVPSETAAWMPEAVGYLVGRIDAPEGTETEDCRWLERVLGSERYLAIGSEAVVAYANRGKQSRSAEYFVDIQDVLNGFPEFVSAHVRAQVLEIADGAACGTVQSGGPLDGLRGARELLRDRWSPETRAAIMARMVTAIGSGNLGEMLELRERTGLVPERFQDVDAFVRVFRICAAAIDPRSLAVLYADFRPLGDDARLDVRLSEMPGLPSLIASFVRLRGPAARAEFCPYETQVRPLWAKLPERLRSVSIMPFFEEFGFKDLPILAEVFIDLRAAKRDAVPVPVQTRGRVDAFLAMVGRSDLRSERVSDIESILKLFHESLGSLRKDVYLDRIPAGIERSELLMELLNAAFPVTGSYGSYENRVERIVAWRETLGRAASEGWSDRTRLPDGMVSATYRVAAFGRAVKADEAALASEGACGVDRSAVDRALDDELRKEPLLNFIRPWREALHQEEGRPAAVLGELEQALLDDLGRRRDQLAALDAQADPKKAKGLRLAIAGMEERLKSLQDSRVGMSGGADDEAFRDAFERIVRSFGKDQAMKLAAPQLHRLAVGIARHHAPQHVSEVRRRFAGREDVSREAFTAMRAWLVEEVLEHLTNPRDEAWAGRPMSPEAFSVFQSLFRLNGGFRDAVRLAMSGEAKASKPTGHAFFDATARILVQERRTRGEAVEGDELSITYRPAHGLGRILASDLGSACYNKHNMALAQNEYPGINAVIMTMDVGGDETAFGSTLFIDAHSPGGEPVLVVRAINPSEASVNRIVSPDGIVETTIDYAIRTAKARGIRRVDLCVSAASAHATNRVSVAEAIYAYGRRHGLRHAGQLRSTPETNFNGYDIWQEGKRYTVWSDDAP